MPTYLEGVLLKLSTSPPSPAGGFVVKAYSTILGTYSGSAVTDGKGRFQIIGLPDRDDWVPVSQGPPNTVAVLEHLDRPELQGMLSGQLLTLGQLEVSGYVMADGEFLNYLDLYDMIVDQDYQGSSPTVKPTLAEAIAAGGVSIFLRNAGDTVPATIAQGDAAQRIQGKDPDTTLLPVNTTCNKANVTIEQLLCENTIDVEAANFSLLACLFSTPGKLSLGISASAFLHSFVLDCRFQSSGIIELGTRAQEVIISRCRFTAGASSFIQVIRVSTDTQVIRPIIANNTFRGAAPLTGYAISAPPASVEILDGLLVQNTFTNCNNGAVNLVCNGGRIVGNIFQGSGGGTTALLQVSSLPGTDIRLLVTNNTFVGGGTDRLFECASADADAAGLLMVGNTFRTGTVLFSQDSVWMGNDFAGCTLNFQNKPGIVVIGGDMTGCPLQNVPNNITFRNVKGQDDRGPFGVYTQPTCAVYHSVAQSIPNVASTNLAYDSERHDSDALHDTVTNNDRITIRRAGIYQFHSRWNWAASAVGRRYGRLLRGNDNLFIQEEEMPPLAAGVTFMSLVSRPIICAVGDWFVTQVYQGSGAALDVVAFPEFSVTKVA